MKPCRNSIFLAIAAMLVAAVAAAFIWRSSTAHRFANQQVVVIALDLDGPPSGRVAASAKVIDPSAIQQIVEMLDRGSFTEPHACVSIGQLRLKRANGSEVSVEILPGHDFRFFEYRDGSVYRRVDRSDFLQAVAPFGLSPESFAGPTDQ